MWVFCGFLSGEFLFLFLWFGMVRCDEIGLMESF
jgi:hypothetical protein